MDDKAKNNFIALIPRFLFTIVYGNYVYYSEQFTAMVSLETIGRRIALTRAEQDMSQEDLAGEAEINRGYLSRIENGHVAFSIPVLLKIADALNIAPDSLLKD